MNERKNVILLIVVLIGIIFPDVAAQLGDTFSNIFN